VSDSPSPARGLRPCLFPRQRKHSEPDRHHVRDERHACPQAGRDREPEQDHPSRPDRARLGRDARDERQRAGEEERFERIRERPEQEGERDGRGGQEQEGREGARGGVDR